jgi:hypothetical protein
MAVISAQTSKLETYEEQISSWIVQEMSTDIFHKNREISILMSKVNTSSGSQRKNQTREDRKNKQKTKTHTGMNKSASLTPVQGPSTVACMIVT